MSLSVLMLIICFILLLYFATGMLWLQGVYLFLIGFFSGSLIFAYILARANVSAEIVSFTQGVIVLFQNLIAAIVLEGIGWILHRESHPGKSAAGILAIPLHQYRIAFSILLICFALGFIAIQFIHEEPKQKLMSDTKIS